jgi:hypothetical protein
MTESLSARLQKRLESQSAEIEAMTVSELRRLASSLKRECDVVLSSTQSDIRETAAALDGSLTRLRSFGRWWWVALIVTWLAIGGLSVWHSLRGSPAQMDQFTSAEGVTYLIPPAGAEAASCTRGEYRFLCIRLPEGR